MGKFTGHPATRKPEIIYQKAHIVVLPSYREGLPKALLEGAATGRPLVATQVPGCQDVIIEGETGFLTPLGDIHALGHALETLIHDANLRQTMGEKGHTFVKQHFSDTLIHQQHVTLYERLLSTRSF